MFSLFICGSFGVFAEDLNEEISLTEIAEEQEEIKGLHEKFNALFMDKCFTEEELATIRNEFEDFYLAWLPQNFEALSYVSKFPKEHTHETYTQHMDTLILDFSTAVRVSYLDGNTWYSEQYAKEGALEYYFLPEDMIHGK